MKRTNLIVVGVDGSEGGQRALAWAAEEAATRGSALQAVTAWDWDPVDEVTAATAPPAELRAQAQQVLDTAVAELTARHGAALAVAAELIEGRPADILVAAARTADLLVLGSHGHSRFWHTVLGSVSEQCIRKAPCPVVVVPVPQPAPSRPGEPALPA